MSHISLFLFPFSLLRYFEGSLVTLMETCSIKIRRWQPWEFEVLALSQTEVSGRNRAVRQDRMRSWQGPKWPAALHFRQRGLFILLTLQVLTVMFTCNITFPALRVDVDNTHKDTPCHMIHHFPEKFSLFLGSQHTAYAKCCFNCRTRNLCNT
jgi:hypothetical protein